MSFLRPAILAAAALFQVVDTPIGGNIATAAETYTMTTLSDERAVWAVAFSKDGARIVFAADDGAARIRETASGSEISVLKWESDLDGDLVHFVAFGPDGSRVVTASSDQTAHIWDAASGRELAVLKHPSAVFSAAFSPDGTRIVTACIDGSAHIWDVASGSELAVLRGHTNDVRDAAFSPDGSRVVTASTDGTARIWDAASGHELTVLKHPSPVFSAAFSPDGVRLVTGSHDEAAHVFDAASGREIAVLRGHGNDVLDANFSPDGTRIVTASYDDSARIWDAGSGQQIAVLIGHHAEVYSATFSPDGERIFTAARDATGRIWTKLPAVRLPDGIAGLWHRDFMSPEQMPEDVVRYMCVTNPMNIHGDGLIVTFMGSEVDPPEPVHHMRCAPDLTCQIFAGAPAQGLEPQGIARFTFSDDAGNLCVPGECTVIARCPAPVWTDEERKSGFAEAWEARVLAPEK